MQYTFENIEKSGQLLYRFTKGSHAHGTALETSDWDEGGIFLEDISDVLSFGCPDEISDKKSDKTWYSLRRFMELLLTSNPTVLEALFVDDKFVIYEHPIITEIKKHRQEFVTKACFKPFLCYSQNQIYRAQSYNKKCVTPVNERLTPLDFCYTPTEQGSERIKDWLKFRGLLADYCGLVSINNMPGCYGVYYDFGAHNLNLDKGDFDRFYNDDKYYAYIQTLLSVPAKSAMLHWFHEHQEPAYYRGIIKCDGKADDVRCSSVKKNVRPICIMSFNKNGFQTHCKQYKSYQDWVKNRNEQRYIDNLGFNYDAKGIYHSFRLINMGLEIAKTGEVHVNREGIDADFLKSIRLRKYTYDELIGLLESKKDELDEAVANSTLPDAIDKEKVKQMLINIRRKYQL